MRAHMTSDHDVLQCRHLGKQPDVLEGPCNAGPGHLVHRRRLIGLSGQLEFAGVGRIEAGDHVEKCGLACAIGADQAIDLASINLHAHTGQCLQTAKALGDVRDMKDR